MHITSLRSRSIATLLIGASVLAACNIEVLQSKNDFIEAQIDAAAALPSVARGATKVSVSGLYAMWTLAGVLTPAEAASPGLGALLEVQTTGFANRLNARNRAVGSRSYEALNLSQSVLDQLDNVSLSTNSVADVKGKALLRGNMLFVQGMLYGNLARYYSTVVEAGTRAQLSPEQSRTKAIALLERARTSFRDFNAQPATPAVPFITTGLIVIGDDKLINSVVGMLQFDAGNVAAAGALLDGGYVAADAARQATFRQDPNGDFSGHDMWTDFSAAATNPRNWFANNNFEYFWPVVANVPFVSWQEVAMMRAQITADAAVRSQLVSSVLTSFGISATDVARIVADPAFTNARIARYVYLGKGRAPISGVATFRRWETPDELTR